MKIKRSILAPVTVSLFALVTGGWLLQQGASQGRNVYLQAQLFQDVMYHVSQRFVDEKEPSELYRLAIDGMLRELGDPHSVFMTPEDYEGLSMQTRGEYGGVGMQIDQKDGWITVIAPLPGTPAERAGLQAGDKIVEVDGESTEGWSTDQAVGELRGPKGTQVEIEVVRLGVDEPIPFRITRDDIPLHAVPTAYLLDDRIGYVELSTFNQDATEELRAALDRLRGEGMRGLILDLRLNPGGLLDQGVGVSDLFLTKGQSVVEMRGRMPGANQMFKASDEDRYPGLPVVVLTGPYSASASEIVAGALQDHDRALVIGSTTFGKGSVQTIYPLSGDNVLKLTTARWYTPSGRSIQKPYGIDATRADQVAAESETPEKYRTDAGRVVLGGGGIAPDLKVAPDTLSAAEQEFAREMQKHGSDFQDALYAYAIRYAHEHPSLPRDFEVTSAMLESFYETLREAELDIAPEVYRGASRWIGESLAVEISRAKWGTEGVRKRLNADDRQVRTALELLRRAEDPRSLFAVADRYAEQTAAATEPAAANRP